MHSTPTRLAGAGDTVLRSPDWPLGLAALFPVPRPGRVAIRWRGHLDVDNLLKLFDSALHFIDYKVERHVSAWVVTGNDAEHLALRSPDDLINYITNHGTPNYLRLESRRGGKEGAAPSVVVWVNHDPAHVDEGAESQQAAGVEIPIGAAQEVRDGIARAVYHTKPPQDAPHASQPENDVLRHVTELMADITDIRQAHPRQSS